MSSNRSSLLRALESAQRESWSQGKKIFVETFLDSHPELSGDRESLLQLILQEHRLRLAAGDSPTLEEYCRRFPQLADELRKLLSAETPPPKAADATKTFPSGGQKTKTIVCPFCSTNLKSGTTHGRIQCDNCGHHVQVLEETAPLQLGAGRRIGVFELVSRLGMGQYGEVWRANDTQLRREVAIKIPRNRDSSNATLNMFLREARAVARLRHPNIVAVYEAGRDEDLVYIVSAFINGASLKQVLSYKRFNFDEAAALCASIAAALEHAHQAGIVHRDLKPSNVLIDAQGVPYIADFGLAKHAALDEITITSTGHVLGTPAYMSPEQARGDSHKTGPASDIYSLGVMLYELLTGKRPFVDKPEVLSYRIMTEAPRPPRSINKQVPADLETICLKALEKSPADRYATAQDMADDLNRFLRGELIHARPATLLQKSARWTRRNWLKAGSVGAVAATTAGIATEFSTNRRTSSLPLAVGPRLVRITTQPLGAHVAFVPMHASGQPLSQFIKHAETTANVPWAIAELAPGDYLVVVEVPHYGFHEVWRHVPAPDETIWQFPHRRSIRVGDYVELPKVRVPTLSIAEMAPFAAGDFTMGAKGTSGQQTSGFLPHKRTVAAFLLDPHEVTVGEYRRNRNILPLHLKKGAPPDDHPIGYVSFEEAVYYAESIGKRLPDEAEFEYAATNAGTTQFPWGDEAPKVGEGWVTGPVGSFPLDRLRSNESVTGLCSLGGEWVLKCAPFTDKEHQAASFARDGWGAAVVRGGNEQALELTADENWWVDLPRARMSKTRSTWLPGLGLRCARSAAPRFDAAAFGRVLSGKA